MTTTTLDTAPAPEDEVRLNSGGTAIKDSTGYTVFRWINLALLLLMCFLILYPFANLVAQAFSAEAYIITGQVNLLPRGFNVAAGARGAALQRLQTGR